MNINNYLVIFSLTIFLIGIILTYLTSLQHSNLSDKCVSKKVQIGMNIILMISTMMIVVPLVQLYCYWGCDCKQNDLRYKWIIIILAASLTIAASYVLNGLNNKTVCNTDGLKSYMIGLISTGVVLIVILGIVPLFSPVIKSFIEDSNKKVSV